MNRRVGLIGGSVFALAVLALLVALIHTLVVNWTGFPGANGGTPPTAPRALTVLGWTVIPSPSLDQRLLFIVVVMGAIGGCVHVTRSFGDFLANRELVWSWVWWYVLRIPLAALAATIFYLVLRGGFLASNGSEVISPYGVAAIAGLVGVFVDLAIDKLKEVFETILSGRATAERRERLKDGLNAPTLVSLDPAGAPAGSGPVSVVATGDRFAPGAVVLIDGSPAATPAAIEPPGRATFEIPADALAQAGERRVALRNPGEGGGTSNEVVFTVA